MGRTRLHGIFHGSTRGPSPVHGVISVVNDPLTTFVGSRERGSGLIPAPWTHPISQAARRSQTLRR